MEYEISPRYAAGIRKNYFQAQKEKSPKVVCQVKSLMSYSGYKFKSPRDLFAYIERLFNQISKLALYCVQFHKDGTLVMLACIATPGTKSNINAITGELYPEDFLTLRYFVISATHFDMKYNVTTLDDHCEVTSHAIDRILQRLKTTKLDNVTEELKSSSRAMMPIISCFDHYPPNRLPKRIVVPSKSGAFLCEVNASTKCIMFRTFVSSEMFDFQEASVNATRAWLKRTKTASCTPKDAQDLFTDKANRWWFEENSKDQKFTSQLHG